MPINPTYPGLYIEELPSSAHTIVPAPTSVTTFVGYTNPFAGECAEYGRWGEAIQIFSFTDYERLFGGMYRSPIVSNHVATAVYEFFLNGGSNAWVVALKPSFHSPDQEIKPATSTELGLALSARQLTDSMRPVRVTIRNLRNGNALADFTITYGQRVETFTDVNLGAAVTDDDHPIKKLARSALIKLDAPQTYPSTFTVPANGFTELGPIATPTGGTWTTFDANDFLSVFDANTSLDKVDIFNLLCIPGVNQNDISNKALSFCEKKRAFYIMDPPPNYNADGTGGMSAITDAFNGQIPTSSPNGALYFPYLERLDSLAPPNASRTAVPPSGYVAGLFARTDVNRGVWKAPAGLETTIFDTLGPVPEGRMTDMRQGVLNPKGINVLRSFPGAGTVIWGARTLVTDNTALAHWRYVPVRRMALFLEQTLMRNLGWVVFEPNDRPLWTAIRISIENFMMTLFRQRAFQGDTPRHAFLVQCDESTTTQTDIDNGIVNILVGFRPLKPAEFVIIKIAQLAGQAQS